MSHIKNYILFNFFHIYEPSEVVNIVYGEDDGLSKIFIPDLSNGFFSKKSIIDTSKIVFKVVGGENIPFLFGVPDVNPFEMANGKVVFNDDIFASAFYFLTGWQELSSTKDY